MDGNALANTSIGNNNITMRCMTVY